MKFMTLFLTASIWLLAGCTATAQKEDGQVPETVGTGPHPAIMEVRPDLPNHVIYRPADMAALKDEKLGLYIFGNGGCRNDGADARFHLTQIASHGYLAIAPGSILSGPLTRTQAESDGHDNTYKELVAALDWALAENDRQGSLFHQRLDPTAIAAAGHSCGGLQALQFAEDPRLDTVVVHNSGVLNNPEEFPDPGMELPDKSVLESLHTPVIYFLGGEEDVAYPNGTDDFARIGHVPAVLVDAPVGHGGTFDEHHGGRVAELTVDWLEWQLRGDEEAAATFLGPDCKLCQMPDWTVETKNLD